MQSGLVHSPKGFRSTGLDKKSPGTPARTLEKQNNCMDWSRIPTFPLLQTHPCTSRVFWVPAVLQQPTSVLLNPKQHLQCSRVLHTLGLSTWSLPQIQHHLQQQCFHQCCITLGISQWTQTKPDLFYPLISPCCSHSHYTIHCLTELWVCALKKSEFSRCGRQNNIYSNKSFQREHLRLPWDEAR